jgi:hypothetical protein
MRRLPAPWAEAFKHRRASRSPTACAYLPHAGILEGLQRIDEAIPDELQDLLNIRLQVRQAPCRSDVAGPHLGLH